jgi:hypothetical protein
MSKDPNLNLSPDYYSARAIEERRLAMSSKDQKVRAIHLQMADKYSELAKSGADDAADIVGDGQRTG